MLGIAAITLGVLWLLVGLRIYWPLHWGCPASRGYCVRRFRNPLDRGDHEGCLENEQVRKDYEYEQEMQDQLEAWQRAFEIRHRTANRLCAYYEEFLRVSTPRESVRLPRSQDLDRLYAEDGDLWSEKVREIREALSLCQLPKDPKFQPLPPSGTRVRR